MFFSQTVVPNVIRLMYCYRMLLLLSIIFCTCGRAQDTPPLSDEEVIGGVKRQEKIFTEAYAHLDAAVLERILSDKFSMRYTAKTTGLSKAQFLAELARMDQMIPDMEIILDSLKVESGGIGKATSRGRRTFAWEIGGSRGGFEENFINTWRREGGAWMLTDTEIGQSTR